MVLKGISFTANAGEFVSVLGPNGVGKSTLFRCMLGLLTPSKGNTFIDERAISEMSAPQLARHIAYIPQSHNPVFNFSVLDMVLMGTTAQTGTFSAPGKDQLERAEGALDRLDVLHLKDRGYANISGGERQRVMIARCLAQQPEVILLDEPLTSFDVVAALEMKNLLREMKDDHIIIFSTHILQLAADLCDEIVILNHGLLEGVDSALIRTPEFESRIIDILRDADNGEAAQ